MIPNVDQEAREEWAAIRAHDRERTPLPVTDTPAAPPVPEERFEDIPPFRKIVPHGFKGAPANTHHRRICYDPQTGQLDCHCHMRHGPRKDVH